MKLGMVGGGQLARMTYQAGIPLGLTLRVLAGDADDSAGLVGADIEVGSPDDLDALRMFAAGCDVVTFDHELVDPGHLRTLARDGVVLRPPPEALRFAQDKRYQREQFAAAGLPVPAYRPVDDADEIAAFAEQHGWPVVAKAVSGGYDGRGVWVVEDAGAAQRLLGQTTDAGVLLLVEERVAIDREIAVLIARTPEGQTQLYDPVETVQRDGILHELIAPARVGADLLDRAKGLTERIAEQIGLVGIMAVELFVSGEAVLINEIATRPHNSGHHSIDGCVTSQFENHVRAVLGWPLGSSALLAPVVVSVNILGGPDARDPREALPEVLGDPDVRVHLYGKGPRPGRKLGHVTVMGDDLDSVAQRARRAGAVLAGVAQEVGA